MMWNTLCLIICTIRKCSRNGENGKIILEDSRYCRGSKYLRQCLLNPTEILKSNFWVGVDAHELAQMDRMSIYLVKNWWLSFYVQIWGKGEQTYKDGSYPLKSYSFGEEIARIQIPVGSSKTEKELMDTDNGVVIAEVWGDGGRGYSGDKW